MKLQPSPGALLVQCHQPPARLDIQVAHHARCVLVPLLTHARAELGQLQGLHPEAQAELAQFWPQREHSSQKPSRMVRHLNFSAVRVVGCVEGAGL